MGNTGSRCNDSMIDSLVRRDRVLVRNVERAFRLVDRAHFLPVEQRPNAYSDVPVKIKSAEGKGPFFPGPLHLSTTDVYVTAIRQLEIEKGHSFLNIGSGVGYFSTVAGFLVGDNGENHGIEYYQNLIDYAEERVDEWVTSPGANSAGWRRPQFAACDVYNEEFLEKHTERYDRIYIGFVHPNKPIMSRVLRMLKINGVLVAPNEDSLCRFVRIEENKCSRELLGRMNFSTGVQHPLEDTPTPFFERIPTLCHLARKVIHRCLRNAAFTSDFKKIISMTILVEKGGRNIPPRHLQLPHPDPNFQQPFLSLEDRFRELQRNHEDLAEPFLNLAADIRRRRVARPPIRPASPPRALSPPLDVPQAESSDDDDEQLPDRLPALAAPDSPPMNDIRRAEARGEERFNQMRRGPDLNNEQRDEQDRLMEAIVRMLNERIQARRHDYGRVLAAEPLEPREPFEEEPLNMHIATDFRPLTAPRADADLSGDEEESKIEEEEESDDEEGDTTPPRPYEKNASHSKRTNEAVKKAIRKKRARIEKSAPSHVKLPPNPMLTPRETREEEGIRMRPQRDIVIRVAADSFEKYVNQLPLPKKHKNYIRLQANRVTV